MSDSIKDLLVRILVDDTDVNKFTKAGSKAVDFGNDLNKASEISAGALALLAGGAVAAGKAAADAETSESALQFALDKFPATADTNAAKLEKLNEQLSLHTKFNEDDYASGQAVLAQFGLTGAQITQLTPLLGDYAAKTGQDLPAAASSLGKALLGQGRALKSVGINFTDTKTLAGNYQEVLTGLTDKVGGYADVQGKTAVGASAILANSTDVLFKKLGTSLLPILIKVTDAGVGLMSWMQKNTGLIEALAGGIGTIAVGILALNAGMKIFAIVQAVQTGTQLANDAAWLASPVTWIILAIIVAIGLLVAAGIWLYNNWGAVTKWIGEAWSNVLDTFTNLQAGLKIIGADIANWWNGLWSGFQGIVRSAWDGIIGWIQSGVNGAISLINGVIRGINNVGGSIGVHLNLIPNISIPRLATGGITNGPQFAMVGDNPSGREAILPLDSPAARDLLGNNVPTELSDRTIDKLARTLAGYVRTQSRKEGTA